MSIRYQYFDSDSGDRIYNSAFFARHLQTVAGDGYVYGKEDELEVTEHSPQEMSVDVGLGKAWVQGRMFEIYSAVENVVITASDPSNDRIDRIVVRLDLPNRLIELDVLDGTPAASPSPPSLTRDTNTWELSLAQVSVTAGATEITNSDITDERDEDTVCGISHHSDYGFTSTLEYARISQSSSQTITDSTEDTLSWDTAVDNPNGLYSAGNPTRLTAQKDGIYLIEVCAVIDEDFLATKEPGPRHLWLEKNSYFIGGRNAVTFKPEVADGTPSQTKVSGANISVIDYLEAGDYYEAKVYIKTDGSDIPTEENYCHFAMVRLGGLST